jgi:uncharacterized C2H2 Zn-finger protein
MLFVPYGFLVPLTFPKCKFTYKNTLDYCAKYVNKEHPFEADEDLMDEIKAWFNE